jgi:hypothetical protein
LRPGMRSDGVNEFTEGVPALQTVCQQRRARFFKLLQLQMKPEGWANSVEACFMHSPPAAKHKA